MSEDCGEKDVVGYSGSETLNGKGEDLVGYSGSLAEIISAQAGGVLKEEVLQRRKCSDGPDYNALFIKCPLCKERMLVNETGYHMNSKTNMMTMTKCGCCGEEIVVDFRWKLVVFAKGNEAIEKFVEVSFVEAIA